MKRAVAFVDGQNLFHAARGAFGSTFPDYDALALATEVCRRKEWKLAPVRFCTGIPDVAVDGKWYGFWTRKLAAMGRRGVVVYRRTLRYRDRWVESPDGAPRLVRTGEEKGIDVRIALDVVGCAYRGELDVALLFSQDQDFTEVADEIRAIARLRKRWIRIASAFPHGAAADNRRGINRTDWIRIDRALYRECLDRRDYRGRA